MIARIPIPVLLTFVLVYYCAPVFAETGAISGHVSSADATAVAAIDRATAKHFTGVIDPSGNFKIEQLPLGATYDMIIDYDGARWEGINLHVPASDYEEEQTLTDDDRATIKQEIAELNKFEDTIEVLAIAGNIQHAAVLVNKLRTRPFVNSKPGEVVWRVELWHFERPDDAWLKVQDELFVTLYRERLQRVDFDKKSIAFTPALGGIALSAALPNADLGAIRLPRAKPGIRVLDIETDETSVGNALRGVPQRDGTTPIRSSRNASDDVPYSAPKR